MVLPSFGPCCVSVRKSYIAVLLVVTSTFYDGAGVQLILLFVSSLRR